MWITKDSDGPVLLHFDEPKWNEEYGLYNSKEYLEITNYPQMYEHLDLSNPIKIKIEKL